MKTLSAGWSREVPNTSNRGARMDLKTVAVIGAGATGRSVARLVALGGYQTILEDVSDVRLEKAIGWITQSLEDAVGRGALRRAARDKAIANLSTEHTVEDAIREADLIIDTLPDEMEMQIELFTILDKFAQPGAVFASTGILPITELAEVTFCAERCIGMRIGENLADTNTIELVRSTATSCETVAACAEFARCLGMSAVVTEESDAGNVTERQRKVANVQS
jgi:3-hydroxyacyl-CoA dehydrogenase